MSNNKKVEERLEIGDKYAFNNEPIKKKQWINETLKKVQQKSKLKKQ